MNLTREQRILIERVRRVNAAAAEWMESESCVWACDHPSTLFDAFTWSDTPQGPSYWSDLQSRMCASGAYNVPITLPDDTPAAPAEPPAPVAAFPGTLRDWFAGQALAGLLQRDGTAVPCMAHRYADDAYIIADAMLKAREAQ